jgi:hypothetical protein
MAIYRFKRGCQLNGILIKATLILFIVLSVSSCGTTNIYLAHPLVADKNDNNVAKIYIIRPKSGFRGVEGLSYSIYFNKYKLLTIANGEYTLFYIKSDTILVTVESYTVKDYSSGGDFSKNTMIKVSESCSVSFQAGETYYLSFKRKDGDIGEGNSYVPFIISKEAAVQMSKSEKPIGLAVDDPIGKSND